jgi:hypothetical protein
MSDQVTWQDFGPAEFDRRRMPKGHKTAAKDQGGLFFVAVEPLPAKPATLPAELDGQAALFGDDPS